MKQIRQDIVDNAFVSTQLEYVRAAALAPPLVPLRGRFLVPTNSEVPEGAETFSYHQYDLIGRADWVGDKAVDLPSVDTTSAETLVKLFTLGASYEFSRQELANAAYAQVPLDKRKAEAAARAIAFKLDAVAQLGDAAHGLYGLFNLPGVVEYTVPADGTGVSKLFSQKTGDLILRDLHGITQSIVTATREVEAPDTLVLPVEAFALISTSPFSDYSDESILSIFLKTSKYITTVSPWSAADYSGAEGVGRMCAYRRAPDVLEFIQGTFNQLPPEPRGLLFKVACTQRTGGVVAYKPRAIAYGDGVSPAAA